MKKKKKVATKGITESECQSIKEINSIVRGNQKEIKDKDGDSVFVELGHSRAAENIYGPSSGLVRAYAGFYKGDYAYTDRADSAFILTAIEAIKNGEKASELGTLRKTYEKDGIVVWTDIREGKRCIEDIQVRDSETFKPVIQRIGNAFWEGDFDESDDVVKLDSSMEKIYNILKKENKEAAEVEARRGLKSFEEREKMFNLDYETENVNVEDDFSVKRDYNTTLSKSIGKEHYDNMHNLIDKCENKYVRKIWDMFESYIKVGSTTHNGRQHCLNSEIFINIEKNAERTNSAFPYQTTFHESGHSIDHAMTMQSGYVSDEMFVWEEMKDGTKREVYFNDMIKRELNDYIDAKYKAAKADVKAHIDDPDYLHEKGYIDKFVCDTMHKDLEKYGKYSEHTLWWAKYDKWKTRQAIIKEISEYPGTDQTVLSDLFSGVTKGKVMTNAYHTNSEWKNPRALGHEGFAHMIALTMAGNKGGLELLKKYMPKSCEMFEKILKKFILNYS